jgi:DNA repair exonuclease SbcCD ATPase subunit
MGDELDASTDKDRVGCTAEALARLTETVGQVIVVSH